MPEMEVCPSCFGRGRSEQGGDCAVCHGRRVVQTTLVPCPTCSGSGRVTQEGLAVSGGHTPTGGALLSSTFEKGLIDLMKQYGVVCSLFVFLQKEGGGLRVKANCFTDGTRVSLPSMQVGMKDVMTRLMDDFGRAFERCWPLDMELR